MPLELVPVRCLTDNYAWLVHGNGQTALIDAPEAAPILAELAARSWSLDLIALTHHHDDHIQAVPELVAMTGARVMGNAADAARLPPLDLPTRAGETVDICGEPAEVIDVSKLSGDVVKFGATSVLQAAVTTRQVAPVGTEGWAQLTLPGPTTGLPVVGFAASSVANQATHATYGLTLPHRYGF